MLFSPLRILGLIASASLPTASIYLSLGFSHINVFTLSGSASMRPMMLFLLSKAEGEDSASTVASTGSNTGLKQLMSGVADFALVSHDVELALEHDDNKKIWKEKRLKTITLAREAMFLIYKPPTNCNQDLVISSSNVEDIYSVFSGYKKSDDSEPRRNLKEWMDNSPLECDVTIKPWVKSSGPIKSGTAKTFVNNPLLDSLKSDSSKTEWLKKVKEGYGITKEIFFAHESNYLHLNSFIQNLKPGFATYFPSSFYFKNKDQMDSLGLRRAKIKHDANGSNEGIETFEEVETKKSSYKWGRTLNLIFSLADIVENTKKTEFINKLLQQLEELKKIKFSHSSESKTLTIDKSTSDDCTSKKFGEKFASSGSSQSSIECTSS